MNIRNQKDTLAKLMATENLTVVHKKVPTAVFDVQNRILTCPILKEDISPDLYDLFMGHEVGHALFTPLEGLHSALSENRTLKGYLNVIEDVRIERKIRDKFNGLRKSFYNAYAELMEIDFFGINNLNIQDLSLIDRINLHTKCGSRLGVEFTEEEQVFVDRSLVTETWEEVVQLANDIYEFSKDNEVRTDMDDMITPQIEPEMFDDEDEEDYEEEQNQTTENEEDGEEEQNQTTETEEDGDETEESSASQQGGAEDENETSETDEELNSNDGGETAREAMTEWNAHDNEDMFVSTENNLSFLTDLTTIYKENNYFRDGVVGYKEVQKDVNEWLKMESEINTYHVSESAAKWTAKKMIDRNKKVVNLMAKEFEMKQSAHIALHARTGKTGRLDPNKLAQYQVVEDVFQRTMMMPKGKNHGVNLMLDWSGSISGQVSDLMEQALVLVMFCKKVDIPFRVYIFTTMYSSGNLWESDNGKLVELVSNEMNTREYTRAIEILAIMRNYYMVRENTFGKGKAEVDAWFDGFEHETGRIYVDIPSKLQLGGTPLDHCMFIMRTALKDFNEKYQIEKSVLTILTDGYSHDTNLLQMTQEERNEYYESGRGTKMTRTIIDPYTRKTHVLPQPTYRDDRFHLTQSIIEWVSNECNAIVTGFFVLTRKRDYELLWKSVMPNSFRDMSRAWTNLRKNGEVLENITGYNKLILTFNTKASDDDSLSEDLVGEKKGKILTAFRKAQKGKVTSRFIANEFIKEIA